VSSFHRPETLGGWLRAEVRRRSSKADAPMAATLKGRMWLAQQFNRAGMWPAQIRAVENLEASICDGRLRAMIQMATGGDKTFIAISASYRLITQDGARRVLLNKVVITTIQRLDSILKGEPEFDPALEVESAFDGHGAALARGPQPVAYNPRIHFSSGPM
jgi:hypothetical protein